MMIFGVSVVFFVTVRRRVGAFACIIAIPKEQHTIPNMISALDFGIPTSKAIPSEPETTNNTQVWGADPRVKKFKPHRGWHNSINNTGPHSLGPAAAHRDIY